MMKTGPNREKMLAKLELGAQAFKETSEQNGEDILLQLMQVIGIKLGEFLSFRDVVAGRAWEKADDPFGYVAVATRNTARRSERKDAQALPVTCDAEHLDWAAESRSVGSRPNGSSGPNYRTLMKRLPEELKTVVGPKCEVPNFPAWASRAGLSPWEQRALDYRVRGISRDGALKQQSDETSRKALAAAYRRLNRRGLSELAATAAKSSPTRTQPSPEQSSGTPNSAPPKEGKPPRPAIVGYSPGSAIVRETAAFDPIPWWSAPVPRSRRTKSVNRKNVPEA